MPARASDSVRRIARRLRAASSLRDALETFASLREIRALRRAHPGLTVDLSQLERRDARRVLVVSLSDDPEQVRLEALLTKALQLRGGRVVVQAFRSSRAGVRLWRAFGSGTSSSTRTWLRRAAVDAARELTRELSSVQDWKALEYRGARVGRQALSTLVRARHDPLIELDAKATRDDLVPLVSAGIDGVHAAERLLDRVRPDVLLMIERGYAASAPSPTSRSAAACPSCSSARPTGRCLLPQALHDREPRPPAAFARRTDLAATAGDEPWNEDMEQQLTAELAGREQGKWFMARRLRHSARRRSPDEPARGARPRRAQGGCPLLARPLGRLDVLRP